MPLMKDRDAAHEGSRCNSCGVEMQRVGHVEASKFELFGDDVDLDRPVITGLPSAEWLPEEPWLQRAPQRVRLASQGETGCSEAQYEPS